MLKATKKQKLFLILLGIVLSLIILETGLRIGGFVLLNIKRSKNVISEYKDEYVILSLGESTTASLYNKQSSWPEQLEILLNERSLNVKFKVINEGIASTDTDFILANIDSNIEKYNPDIVITSIIRLDNFFGDPLVHLTIGIFLDIFVRLRQLDYTEFHMIIFPCIILTISILHFLSPARNNLERQSGGAVLGKKVRPDNVATVQLSCRIDGG